MCIVNPSHSYICMFSQNWPLDGAPPHSPFGSRMRNRAL